MHQGAPRLAARHHVVRIAAPPAGIFFGTDPIQLVAAVALKDANLDFDQAGLLADGKSQGRGDRLGGLAGTLQGAAKDRLGAQILANPAKAAACLRPSSERGMFKCPCTRPWAL